MNVNTLRDALRTKMLAALPPPKAQDTPDLTAFCQALAEAVIEHIQNNAEVDGSDIT